SLAQGTDAGHGWRVGITLGGISTAGIVIEHFRDANSVELTLGTFAFRDLGISPVAKHYFGGRAARPYVGGGLWMVLGSGSDARRTGVGLVARVPVGVDWNVTGRHAVGA